MELNRTSIAAFAFVSEHEGKVTGVVPPGFETKVKQLFWQPTAHTHAATTVSVPRTSALLSPLQASLRHMTRPARFWDAAPAIYLRLSSEPISTPAPKATAKVATAVFSGCR